MFIRERHALILCHGPRYHLLDAHHAMHISAFFTAVFNEQLWITLVQPFKLGN